jgi:hypothetical protein
MRTKTKFTAVLVVMAIGMPFLPWTFASPGDGGRAPGPAHMGKVVLDDMSAQQLVALSVQPNGSVELERETGHIGFDEFVVSNGANSQRSPDIAVGPEGDFMMVWVDLRNGTHSSIYGQLFDAAGNKLWSEVVVSTGSTHRDQPKIAVNPANRYLVTWTDQINMTNVMIRAQMLDGSGNKLGSEFSVDSAGTFQTNPAVASGPDGNFAIAWEDKQGAHTEIYAQRFDRNGTRLGGEIQVTSGSGGDQWSPDIAFNSAGDLIIAWTDDNIDSGDVVAQRYGSGGSKVGGKISVAVSNGIKDALPDIAVDSHDSFIITYHRSNTTTGWDVYAKKFGSSGMQVGPEITVTTQAGDQMEARTVCLSNDDYMIGWTDMSGPSDYNIFAQKYSSAGDKVGAMMWVAIYPHSQYNLALDLGLHDALIFVWSTNTGGSTGFDIHARIYIRPYKLQGTLTTDTISPTDLMAWSNLTTVSHTGTHNTLSFESSLDGGTSWQAVPGNGSLAGAGPIRIRARFATIDNTSSPSMSSMTLNYFSVNSIPAVSLPAGFTVWKKTVVNITADATDPDNDTLTYLWNQTGGPVVSLASLTSPNISFTPNRSGLYSFKVVAADGYNDSLPAFINITVNNHPPAAVLAMSAPSANVSAPVTFNASGSSDSDDSITAYNFSFGDGSSSGWTPNSTAVHAYAAAGNYSATVRVRDEEGNETTSAPVMVQVATIINPRPRIVITDPTENEVFSTRTVTVNFTVSDFAVANGSGHIHFYLDNGTVVMWYSLAPYTYTGVLNGNHTLKAVLADPAHVELTNQEATAIVNFHVVPIELADLTLTASDITVKPAKPKDGETVTLSATIYNTGDTDAKSFVVQFLVDGAIIGDQTVTLLAKGGNIVREVSWTAKAGSHTLKVVIDSSSMIPELDETNNMASVSLSVADAAVGSNQLLVLAIAVVVIIVLAALAAILMMRRKKPATVMPYQPPPAYAPMHSPPPQPAPAAPPPQPPTTQPPAPPATAPAPAQQPPSQQPPSIPPPT